MTALQIADLIQRGTDASDPSPSFLYDSRVLFAASAVGGQGSSPTPPFYDANEGLILLDVVVTDQAGKPVWANPLRSSVM